MALFKSEEINNATEELLVTGMLHNSVFLSVINNIIDVRHFDNDDCSVLAELALEFFDDNKEAPGIHSIELLESVKNLIDEQSDNVEKLLKKMDKKYGGRDIHHQVLMKTYVEWSKGQALRETSKEIDRLLKLGKTAEAEQKMEEARQHLRHHGTETVPDISIFNKGISALLEHSEDIIIKHYNILDKFLPPQSKNRFYTYLGGKKAGKSQHLQFQAISGLENGLNVLAFTFELTEGEYLGRLWHGITGKRIDLNPNKRDQPKTLEVPLPVFDCVKNRDGSCERPELPSNFEWEDYDEYMQGAWNPCDFCIGKRSFDPIVWKEKTIVDVIRSPKEFEKEQEKWRMQHSGEIRVVALEPGSATVQDIRDKVERLQLIEGFIPDLIVIDSADNLISTTRYNDKRHELGSIWLQLSAFAKAGYLIWTASQTNREGWGKEWIEDRMISEDASKLMVVDGMISINEHMDRNAGINEKYWQTQRLRAHDYRSAQLPHYDLRLLNDFSRYMAVLDVCKM